MSRRPSKNSESRSDMTMGQHVAFIMFIIAICGFMAQGFMSFYTARMLGKNFLLPPQVLCIWISAFLLVLNSGFVLVIWRRKNWRTPCLLGGSIALFSFLKFGVLQGKPNAIVLPFQVLTGVLVFLITYYMMKYKPWQQVLIRVMFLMSIITSVVALYEYLVSSNFSWSIYSRYVASSGLEASPVQFPNALLFPVILASGVALNKEKIYGMPGRVFSTITGVFGVGGILVAQARSGLFGLVFGLIFSLMLIKKRDMIGLFFVSLAILPFLLWGISAALAFFGKGDIFEDSRIYGTWVTYGPVAIMNPFGIEYANLLEEVLSSHRGLGMTIDETLLQNVITIAPHNLILSNAFRYGWLGVFAIVRIYVHTLRIGIQYAGNDTLPPPIKRCFSLVAGSIIALVFHCFFHNANILMGEMRNWVQLGFLCGLVFVVPADDHQQSKRKGRVMRPVITRGGGIQ